MLVGLRRIIERQQMKDRPLTRGKMVGVFNAEMVQSSSHSQNEETPSKHQEWFYFPSAPPPFTRRTRGWASQGCWRNCRIEGVAESRARG